MLLHRFDILQAFASFLCDVFVICVLVALLQNADLSKIINEQGCLEAIEEWTEQNMISLASCTFVILFCQVSVSSLNVAGILNSI